MPATVPEMCQRNISGGREEIELSIIIPCLNEAGTVGRCVDKALEALRRMGVLGEVIVADNGSFDGSQDKAVLHGARVVRVARLGYGAAVQGGVAAARGRYVIMGDADDSYDFSQIEPFLVRLRGRDDLVVGNRFQGGIEPGAMPWLHRYIGNPLLSGLLNLFFHTASRDAHCGIRAFRKDAYERLKLRCTGMEFASEMVLKASLFGLRMSEVPIVLHRDGRDHPPHLRSFRDGWRHLRFLLLLCPFWLYLIPAIVLLSVGLTLMIWLAPGPRALGGVIFDVQAMVAGTACVLVGYQTLWLWAYAKSYGSAAELLPHGGRGHRLLSYFDLERGILAGALLLLVDVALIL
jgi:glycosyltransferase involved in cell wall biosynthesis